MLGGFACEGDDFEGDLVDGFDHLEQAFEVDVAEGDVVAKQSGGDWQFVAQSEGQDGESHCWGCHQQQRFKNTHWPELI